MNKHQSEKWYESNYRQASKRLDEADYIITLDPRPEEAERGQAFDSDLVEIGWGLFFGIIGGGILWTLIYWFGRFL
jgi:hypothetical protein